MELVWGIFLNFFPWPIPEDFSDVRLEPLGLIPGAPVATAGVLRVELDPGVAPRGPGDVWEPFLEFVFWENLSECPPVKRIDSTPTPVPPLV